MGADTAEWDNVVVVTGCYVVWTTSSGVLACCCFSLDSSSSAGGVRVVWTMISRGKLFCFEGQLGDVSCMDRRSINETSACVGVPLPPSPCVCPLPWLYCVKRRLVKNIRRTILRTLFQPENVANSRKAVVSMLLNFIEEFGLKSGVHPLTGNSARFLRILE